MVGYETSDKKQVIISATWEYLLKKGLAQASIGDLYRETKLAQSSLYYWFKNKDDIWISAGKYGLSKVVDALFAFTLKHMGDVRKYFDTILDEVDQYRGEIRCVVQLTTSPTFGERMRNAMKEFNFRYEDYAKQLEETFHCTYAEAEYFIYSTLSAIVDYVIWDDREKTQMLLESLYQRIVQRFKPEA